MLDIVALLEEADDALGYAKGGDASTDEDHGWALISIAGSLLAIAQTITKEYVRVEVAER